MALLRDAAYETGQARGEAAAKWAAETGVQAVSLAGMEGDALERTRLALGGSAALGAGETEADAYRPFVANLNGVRVGVLSLAERRAGGFDRRADVLHPMAYDRVRMMQAQCDHVLVFCHAGLPGTDTPLPEWRERYRRFIDAGASVVAGIAPDGVRGWEEYKNGLVFYGLGTLADDRAGADCRSLSVLLTLGRNAHLTYETRMVEYENGQLRFGEDAAFRDSLEKLNALLADKKAYLARVDALCRAAQENWSRQSRAGFGRGLVAALLPQAEAARRQDETRLLSLLKNESLRLAVFRALATKEPAEARHAGEGGDRP